MPDSKERVDLLEYDKDGTWRFYELKVSKSDFKSDAAHTFRGHFNYYVMPDSLYDQVHQYIPQGIGVITCSSLWNTCSSVVSAKRKELEVNHDDLMFSFMQSLSRENDKFIKFKEAIRKAGI